MTTTAKSGPMVVATVSDPNGEVIASAVCHEIDRRRGPSLRAWQNELARDRAIVGAVRYYLLDSARAILGDRYLVDQLWSSYRKNGWRLNVVEIGHD